MAQKLNIGCGLDKRAGYVNIDYSDKLNPDLVWDLEQTPWPFEDNSVDEIVAFHVLEHVGQSTKSFFAIIKDLYRICQDGAVIHIRVPHPRHDDFISDPTHVRPITEQMLLLFDRELNKKWATLGYADSQLGLSLDVDFEIVDSVYVFEPPYLEQLRTGILSKKQFDQIIKERFNILKEIRVTWRVRKSKL
jgi:hypothetical protein